MGHITKEREIFLHRVLQQQHVTLSYAAHHLHYASKVEDEGHDLVVVERGGQAEVHGPHLAQRALYVGLRFVAGTVETIVVAGDITEAGGHWRGEIRFVSSK